jgi:hypothetical protein
LVESLGFWVAVVHGMGGLVESSGFEAVVVHGMDNLVGSLGIGGGCSRKFPYGGGTIRAIIDFIYFFIKIR